MLVPDICPFPVLLWRRWLWWLYQGIKIWTHEQVVPLGSWWTGHKQGWPGSIAALDIRAIALCFPQLWGLQVDGLFFSSCGYLNVNLSAALEGVLFPQFPRWFCIVLEWKACRHFLQCCVLLAQSICSRPPSATSSLFDCVHDTAVPRFFFSLCCLNTEVSLCNVAASVTCWFQIFVPLHYFWGVDDCDVCSNLTRLFLVFFYFSLRMLVCTPVVVSHLVSPLHPCWSSNFVSRSLVGNLCIVVYCLPSPRMQYTADLSILSLEGW